MHPKNFIKQHEKITKSFIDLYLKYEMIINSFIVSF